MATRDLTIIGAREHNLKGLTLAIPRNALTVVTGLSGSGKSSLAFDTIHAEGRRRYIESLSSFARQFLDPLERPDVEHIEGLSPSVAIEQKTISHNPRSTVGTVTEIYDHLRVLFSVLGHPQCPECGRELEASSPRAIVEAVMKWPAGTRVVVMAPIIRGRKGIYREELEDARKRGYVRAKVDGEYVRLDETIPTLARNKAHHIGIVVDRVVVGDEERGRIEAAVDRALEMADGLVAIDVVEREGSRPDEDKAPARRKKSKAGAAVDAPPAPGERLFSKRLACPEHGAQLVELTPRMFSFNSPFGQCPECKGVGALERIDVRRIVPDPSLSLRDGAIAPWRELTWTRPGRGDQYHWYNSPTWKAMARDLRIDLDVPWTKLPERAKDLLLEGEWQSAAPHKRPHGGGRAHLKYEGVVPRLMHVLENFPDHHREEIEAFLAEVECASCKGTRLRPEALAVRVGALSIADLSRLSVSAARRHFGAMKWSARDREIGGQVIREIEDRLGFLDDVGVGYLSLDRRAGSLAGGEAQRIRLATQLGSRLTGVLYVLDEPSIGLHMRDNARLIATLAGLRDRGNTVIVVEHDEATMRAADHVVDLGPGAGRLGGELVAAGTPADIAACERSLTGKYLRGAATIEPGRVRRPADPRRVLRVLGAAEHNLREIDVTFPLGCFICITGVSGSGKSTLVNDVLLRALGRELGLLMPPAGRHRRLEGAAHVDKIVEVDQAPIGRTPRSNVATYAGVFTPIRDLFAELPDAQIRGYTKGYFSFNVEGGRCEACKGDGYRKIAMAFLPDVFVPCEACHTRRYTDEVLQVVYRGKSIADVLEMTVGEALEFFEPIPRVRRILQTIHDVGLDYIHVGQPAPTLSGGEAQRVKLSRELAARNTGRTFYMLDEPTTGLHFDDVRRLVDALQRLVDEGSTVCVIEHNLDVIKCADWIVDLGPEGGEAGGEVVVAGTPEQVARHAASYTGQYLRGLLSA